MRWAPFLLLVAPERTAVSKPTPNSRAPPVWNLTQQSNFKKLEDTILKIIKGVYNTLTGKYEEVEVSEEVYLAYTRSNWKIKNNSDAFYSHEIQMSSLIGGGDDSYENFHEFISSMRKTEDDVSLMSQIKSLKRAISTLSEDDRELINELFYNGLTEREYQEKTGMSHQLINYHKQRILRLLKEKLEGERNI